MYEFSSDAWRVIDVDTYDWDITSHGVSLIENSYWIAFDKETGFFLLNFDFTTERFGRLSLPFQSQDWKDTAVLSVVKDERLSLLYQNLSTFSLVMEIWVTNKIVDTKDMSWSNFLVVEFEKFMLPSVTNVRSFLLDEENKVAVCCDKGDEARTRIYIVGEDIYKEASKEITKGTWALLVSYVPSLVLIEKTEGVSQNELPSFFLALSEIIVHYYMDLLNRVTG